MLEVLVRGRHAKRANQPDETGLQQELVWGLKCDAGKMRLYPSSGRPSDRDTVADVTY
jgi:hypothetical protein